MQRLFIRLAFFAVFSLKWSVTLSQNPNCDPDVFSVVYQGNAACVVSQTVVTSQNEVISAGMALQLTSPFEAYDGWLCKLSPRGSFVWAKRYMPPGYNTGSFSSIVAASDSTYIVTGNFSFGRKRTTDFVVEILYSSTVMMMVDKYGNLVWMKYFNKFATRSSSIERVFPIQGGDFIASIAVNGNNFSRRILARIDAGGNVKWSSIFHSDENRFNFSVMKQTANGNLVFAGTTYSNDFSKSGYLISSVDANTGNPLWERAYLVVNTTTSYPGSVGGVAAITELSNGDVSIHTSFADTGWLVLSPHFLKAATLVTNSIGVLTRATGYFNENPGCVMMDASPPDANGNQVLLMDDGEKGVLATVDGNGTPIIERVYGQINGNLAPNKILPGNRILFTGRTRVAMMGFIKTDTGWDISCKTTPANIIAGDVKSAFAAADIQLTMEPFDRDLFVVAGGGINRIAYNFTPTVDCEITCCTNTITRAPRVELCNVPFYTLPNGDKATETGIYDITYHTLKGCDSTVIYDINLFKNPDVSLGDDVCLEGRDSIILKATPGYAIYRWMNLETPDSSFTARQAGKYWVQVTNLCGTTIDTIQVFEKCEFPIYIPSGFTPNNDGLNDIFRIPKENRNRLVVMKIFNRWGDLVFETTDSTTGWNGKNKGHELPTDTYVYFIVMETLDKRRITKTGTITLIR